MGTIKESAGGERGKGRVLAHGPQAAQHGPEDPKGARIPHTLPLYPRIPPLPTGLLLRLSILSPASHKFRQIEFRLFPLTIETNHHLIRGRKGSELTT